MAQASGTFDSYSAVGNREELSEAIYMITPEETPVMTLIGREPVKSTHPEWQTDKLATPAENAVVEGNDWSFTKFEPTARVGNYTQISEKTVIVTRTQDKTLKAGRKSELKRETKKKGAELKRDMEFAIIGNQASTAGNSSSVRKLGSLQAWLETNTDRGTSGADGGFNSGTGVVDAATAGTQRAFAKTQLDSVLEQTYTSGGNPKSIVLSPYAKRVFSGFASADQLRSNQSQGNKDQLTIFAGADTYVSDFGVLTVIPNRVMSYANTTAQAVFCLDSDKLSVGIFDDIQLHEAAKTGDAEKRALNVEYTLKVDNEAASGMIADIFGRSATT